nr:chloroplast envelope membrane protein [Palmellopsis texensis]
MSDPSKKDYYKVFFRNRRAAGPEGWGGGGFTRNKKIGFCGVRGWPPKSQSSKLLSFSSKGSKYKKELFKINVNTRDSSESRNDIKEKVVSITYEEIGLFPRSFNRVFDRFLKQLFSDVENLVLQEYRFYRYLFLTTLKTIFLLFFVPFLVNLFTKNYLIRPLTEYFWNSKQSEIFLNSYQQKRAFAELKEFEETLFFESLISSPKVQNQQSYYAAPPHIKSVYVNNSVTRDKSSNNVNSWTNENPTWSPPNSSLGTKESSYIAPSPLKLPYDPPALSLEPSAVALLAREQPGGRVRCSAKQQQNSPPSLFGAKGHLVATSYCNAPGGSEGKLSFGLLSSKQSNEGPGGLQINEGNGNLKELLRSYGPVENPPSPTDPEGGYFVEGFLLKYKKEKLQQKTIELAIWYNKNSVEAITNIVSDFLSFLTLIYLLISLEIQINVTKSFLLEVFFGLEDSKKSLLILLITDLLVGYHSPNIWEFFFEFSFNHYGIPESQTVIFLLVATLPVLLDVLFKYLIFRHLNRSSPATVATYHAMIE